MTSASFRTPLEDLPVILIPGVSGTKLIAEQRFSYWAPPNPELAIPFPDPFQLLPAKYDYPEGAPIWLHPGVIIGATLGQYRLIDALMLNHYGSTPEPDVMGDTSRKIVPGDILWNVDLGVTKADFYGELRDHLIGLGYNPADKAGAGSGSRRVYYFGYDWRKDVYPTGRDLNALVKRAMAETGKTKVNIIAHSMGGWVTRNYLLQYGASDVDQVITLGTPFLGAPKALKVLEHGDEWGMLWHPANDWGGPLGDLGIGLHPKQMKRLAQNFPAAYELLPSKYWFQGRPFSFTENPAYITRSVNNSGTLSYELLGYGESSQFLRHRHNYDLVRTAERFHAQGIGDLSLLTNQYIHHRIMGTEVSTNGRIEYSPRKVCATFPLIGVQCTDLPEFAFPKMNLLGDGTVPFHSALGAYAPPDGRAYRLPGAKHNPLTSDARSLTLITEMLSGGPKGPGVMSMAAAPAADSPAAESFVASGVEIAVLGGGNLTITDDQGRVSGHVPGSPFATVQQIPGVTYEAGEGAQVAMLPSTGTYRVTIRGTPAGGAAQLRMSEVDGGTNTETLVFRAIPLTEETVATATASGAGVPASSTLTFKYDASSAEQTVGTLPIVTGSASGDMSPPISQLSMNEKGVVTITARDEPGGSGVASILYSTDGVTFKIYTAPFRAPKGTRMITAVGVDRAGNAESPGAKLQVAGSATYLPLVRR
jgi:pimeloyl-ACP methyl ester carboxylesterase